MKINLLNYLLILGLGALGARGMDLNSLVERSPFAPPRGQVVEQTNEVQPQLEFRGIATDEGGTIFSVYDIAASRGYWLREGEVGALAVKSYSLADRQIVVEQGGRMLSLQLKRASILAGAVMAIPMPANNSGQANRPATNPAADGTRLEAVAAEVRRRRALRSAVQSATPVPAVVPTPAAP